MKKALLLVSILFISVISTACINNFAVQELNNKAKSFMDKGDYANAIERLKSSIDLDGSVFETRYNLAVAYTKAEDYSNAVDAYNEAIKLNPDFADAYYSLAVCEENLAKDIISGLVKVNEDGSVSKIEKSEDDKELVDLSDSDKNMVATLLGNSISDYKIYLDKAANPQDKEDVDSKIQVLETMKDKYGTADTKSVEQD